MQVYEQTALADRLYRDPEWRRELLGLTGDPPPLSAIPLTNRPAPTLPLIGRDENLAWLRQTRGDLLLVGEPGMGKTVLLTVLARAGAGLFVAA